MSDHDASILGSVATSPIHADANVSQNQRKPLDVLNLYSKTGDTLWGLVESRAAVRRDEPFLLSGNDTMGWMTFHNKVLRVASMLTAQAIKRGDRVAIMASNSMEYVVLFFSTARIGAIFVPVNPDLGVSEAHHIFKHAKPSIVFCTNATRKVAVEACGAADPYPKFVSLDEECDGGSDYKSLVDHASTAISLPDPSPDDTCLILYTSGTTGLPKGVMHSQRNYVVAAEGFVERLYLQPEDRLLCILPFFHTNGLVYSLGGASAAGGSLVIAPRFSASNFWRLAEQSGATQVNIIAAVGRILARRPREEFVPSHKIRKVYGVPITPDIYDTFRNDFGVPNLVEGYGMTEVPGVCSIPFDGPGKVGSMGCAALHPDHSRRFAEMRVVGKDLQDVPDGEVGQLLVRTPIVMQGYWNDPEATAAAFHDGWFLTGDLARRDQDGFYTFIARQKDIIRRRGENISGAELDQIINQLPGVEAAATIGVESELGEEEILVAIVKKAGATLTAQDVRNWCEQRLSAIKIPRFLIFMDSLPYTPTHRIAKFVLKQDLTLRGRAIELRVNHR
ncbi:MAG: AMP-binding protein [Paralcaligenes sp.]